MSKENSTDSETTKGPLQQIIDRAGAYPPFPARFLILLYNGLVLGPIVKGKVAGFGNVERYYLDAPVQLFDCRAVCGLPAVWLLDGRHINGSREFWIKAYQECGPSLGSNWTNAR